MSKRVANLIVAVALALGVSALSASSQATAAVGLWPAAFDGTATSTDCSPFQVDSNKFCYIENDGSVELGVKFTSSKSLYIMGLRIYRTDPGSVTGSLWTAAGARLTAATTFAGAATHSWQDVLFLSPVAIANGATYIASYHAPGGDYAFQYAYFTSPPSFPGPITPLQSVVGNGNGVFCYAGDSCFPDGSFRDSNYWVTPLWDSPPTLTVPADMTVEANTLGGATVTYTPVPIASDDEDGQLTPVCTPATGGFFALGSRTVTCSVTDADGLSVTKSFNVTVQDTKPPTLRLPSDVTTTAATNSSKVVTFSASATDVVDGSVAVTCVPASGSTFSVGATPVNCSATDAHGNTATGSFTVTVNYSWTGFFQPIDNIMTVNTVQAGSGVPVKFSLSGYQGPSIFAAGYPKLSTLSCSSVGTDPTDAIETTTSSNSGLNYDSTNDQYTYVWKTQKGWAGTCGQLDVKLIDNTTHSAYFKFLK